MSSSGLSCLWHVFASYLQSILFIVLQFLLVLHPIGHPIYSEAIFYNFYQFCMLFIVQKFLLALHPRYNSSYLQCSSSYQFCILLSMFILFIVHSIYSAVIPIYSPSYLYVHPVHSTTYLFCMQFIDCPCNYVALVCHIAYVIIIPHW